MSIKRKQKGLKPIATKDLTEGELILYRKGKQFEAILSLRKRTGLGLTEAVKLLKEHA